MIRQEFAGWMQARRRAEGNGKHKRQGWYLGSEEFRQRLLAELSELAGRQIHHLSACGEKGNFSGMKTVAAHFDGKQIVLEEPVKLTAQTKLRVIVAEEGESFSDDDMSPWFLRLSEPAFAKVWDNARDADYDKL